MSQLFFVCLSLCCTVGTVVMGAVVMGAGPARLIDTRLIDTTAPHHQPIHMISGAKDSVVSAITISEASDLPRNGGSKSQKSRCGKNECWQENAHVGEM